MRSRIINTIMVVMWLMLCASNALADLHWISSQETKGVPDQPDETVIVNSYLKNNVMRIEEEELIIIIDYNTMMMYQLNTVDKTYSKMDLNEMHGISSEELKIMQAMMGNVKLAATDEEKTIAGYKCKKYIVSFMITSNEYWVSKEVKGYEEFRSLGKIMAEKVKNNPLLKMTDFAAILSEMDGFPVQMIVSAMGTSIINTLTSIEQKTLPQTLFQVPADYTLIEMSEDYE